MRAYLDLLLLGESLLHLLLELLLDLLGLRLVLLVVLLEILLVLLQDLVALLQRPRPFLGLAGQVADLLLDDAVGHRDQEHLLLLLQYLHDGLVLARQVLVFATHLYDFEGALGISGGTSISFFSFWLKELIGTYLSSMAVW